MIKKNKKVNNFDRSVESYFTEIGKTSPLSRDEEYELWKKYKFNNDITARNRLVSSNLKFVANIAKGYQGMGLPYSDLIAEGNIGLMKGIERFNGDLGNKLISYSVWWIRQTIMEAIDKRGLMDADDLPCDFEKNKVSDGVIEDECETSTTTLIDDNGISSSIDFGTVLPLLSSCLSDRENMVVSKYYGVNGEKEHTLEEIGSEMGLTKERVRQINERSLKKLRSEALNNLNEQDLNFMSS